MQTPDYDSFGGVFADCAAIRNLLRHAGVLNPATGRPLTEAAVFGVGGGIGMGYAFCPSVPRGGRGSGMCIVGQHGATSYDGGYQRAIFDRLGVAHAAEESSTTKAAQKKLLARLEEQQPALVQCAAKLDYHGAGIGGFCLTSSWSVVVHGIDEAKQQAHVADVASTSIPVPRVPRPGP